MTFRPAFDCLWCGAAWTAGDDALEGWAQLCPDCLGRAGDNPFLAMRLRAGIAARGASARAAAGGDAAGPAADGRRDAAARPLGAPAAGDAPAGDRATPPADPAALDRLEADLAAWLDAGASRRDDRYARAGTFSRGPVRDLAWQMELDAATTWLDRLPVRGTIVELGGGSGWWTPLLAGKGELTILDPSGAALDLARRRLVAHGLTAHLHVADPWAEPDAPADAVLLADRLCHVPEARLAARLATLRRRVAPGGLLAIVDRLGDPESDAADDPPPIDGVAVRTLPDGRAVTIPLVIRTPDAVTAALRAAGFGTVRVTSTGRFFLLAEAS